MFRQVILPSQAGQLGPVLDFEHFEYPADMRLDRHFAETHLVGNFAVFVAQGDKFDNLQVLRAQAFNTKAFRQCPALFDQDFQMFLIDPDVTIVNYLHGLAEACRVCLLGKNAADVVAQQETGQVGLLEARIDQDKSRIGMCIDEEADVFSGIEEDDICVKVRWIRMTAVERCKDACIAGQFFDTFAKEPIT